MTVLAILLGSKMPSQSQKPTLISTRPKSCMDMSYVFRSQQGLAHKPIVGFIHFQRHLELDEIAKSSLYVLK